MATSSRLISPKDLDLLSLPLTGRSLIEASAGTGKTYSLAFIYLRLLLGIGENNYQRPLSVEEILVVTFTKAATEELRYRIRHNISQLRKGCLQGFHADINYQRLLDLIDDKSLAAKRLLYAQQSMDQVAIFTIHSFCQRLLTTYAFESGSLFNKVLLKDEMHLYLQQVQDFWREYFTPMPTEIAAIIWQNWADPQALLADLLPYLNRELPENVVLSEEPIDQRIFAFHQTNIAKIDLIKQQWLINAKSIHLLISQSDVNKRSYTKNNLERWINSVSDWASLPTQDFTMPVNELTKFSQSELINKTDDKKKPPIHELFTQIEQLLAHSFSLRDAILFDISAIVSQKTQKQKAILAQMGFDDLLSDLRQALYSHNSETLIKHICHQYPVAMIDEFQDTDPVQYQIFDKIYGDRQNTLLLFIGDPKQAIYGFRGADIFTYIKAKLSVDHHFTMSTNWRSTSAMVDAVNSLFARKQQPFIFEQIPFIHMKSAEDNRDKACYIDDQPISAMQCCLLPESITSNTDYQAYSAEYCAEQIRLILSTNSYFTKGTADKKPIKSSDIAILVRTGQEAETIQQALRKRNIKSVYVSNRQSVFASLEAKEVLRILQAVMMPTNENYLRSALATRLIGATMEDIDELSIEPQFLEQVIEEFQQYQTIWLSYGVLVMLRRLMNNRHLAENLLSLMEGERIITNFMHIGELLQEVSQEFDTPHALIRWLTKQINQPDNNATNHEQRLESDENLINIITIHKSKGLEYPIVFLPFVAKYRESESAIYHNLTTYEAQYAYQITPEIKQLIEQERLAEDLRLLYVALTRSVYHCCFTLASLKKGRAKESSLIHSAIGYLLLEPQASDYEALQTQLTQLMHTNVVSVTLPIELSVLPTPSIPSSQLIANVFRRKLATQWRVISYSGLQQSSIYLESHSTSTDFMDDMLPAFDREALEDVSSLNEETYINSDSAFQIDEPTAKYDIHHFPKGAVVGTLLHESLEKIDFTQPNVPSVVNHLIATLNLEAQWQLPLSQWLEDLLQAPLSDNLSLAKISKEQRLNELPFYLPIRQNITAKKLDSIAKKYDPLSQCCEPLDFATVQGMLKGFIDMIFQWQGKYYLVDYKSNYLGESVDHYTQTAMQQAMCEHRYDLQYQLYTLALHRYLQSRLPDYRYQTHFGGVYYLFIRGMTTNHSGNGIFYTKPDDQFISQLDRLFG